MVALVRCHHVIVEPLYAAGFTEFYCSSECYATGLDKLVKKYGWRAQLTRKPDGKAYDYDQLTHCAVCGLAIPHGSRDRDRAADDPYGGD